MVAVRAKDKEAEWIKADEFQRPVLIPGGTEAIELLLRDSGATLAGVRIWRIEEPQGVRKD